MADPRSLRKRDNPKPSAPAGGGGGGGGPQPPAPPKPVLPATGEHVNALKAIFQYLSPEDQKSLGALYGITPTSTDVPTQITGQIRNTYMSADRAQQALTALGAMQGLNKGGAGYAFLQNALGLLKQYGGTAGNGMSRENYTQFSTQLKTLLDAAKNDKRLSPFTSIAEAFLNPSFSAGQLFQSTKAGGQEYYGAPNTKLFT